MQNTAYPDKPKRTGRSPVIEVPLSERAFYNMNELAAMCGKQTTWAYRLFYEGKIKVNKSLGRMLVPRSELERLQREAA